MSKAILVILDGWGLGQNPEVDALAQAETPFYDSLLKEYPHSTIVTYGEDVGLPEGQMGNSEVGHLNIGAGRVVYQDFTRINKSIKDGEFKQNPVLQELLSAAKAKGKKVHLIGLLSDGGVHSHIDHLKSLSDACHEYGITETHIHAFLDGRDTSPHGGKAYLEELLTHIDKLNVNLSSIIGRYYAMDRDTRWERTKKAYDLLVNAQADHLTDDPLQVVQQAYDEGITDEFMHAILVTSGDNQSTHPIEEGDTVICFNYRTDRPRQITQVLTQVDMPDQLMKKLDIDYGTMTTYDEAYQGVKVLFTKDNLKNTIGEVLADAGKTQVRIAETEKYPHVTFFFSGGREDTFSGEDRILVPSPKVATYDLQPEMSASEVTNQIVSCIQLKHPDFICLNYANTDMVGHTGDFEAAMKAAQTVDTCLKKLTVSCLEHGYEMIIIADHGNSDIMKNEDGSAHTAHTTNLVPIIHVGGSPDELISSGRLADIAPTLLGILGISAPEEMTGKNLISKKH